MQQTKKVDLEMVDAGLQVTMHERNGGPATVSVLAPVHALVVAARMIETVNQWTHDANQPPPITIANGMATPSEAMELVVATLDSIASDAGDMSCRDYRLLQDISDGLNVIGVDKHTCIAFADDQGEHLGTYSIPVALDILINNLHMDRAAVDISGRRFVTVCGSIDEVRDA